MQKDVRYINVAKSIGIILVVLGHCVSKEHIEDFINLFHMPLFFFISGYLFNEKYFDNPYVLLEKRVKSLYLPYVFWLIVFTILHNSLFSIHFYDETINNIGRYTIENLGVRMLYIVQFRAGELLLPAMWFLTALFMTNFVFVTIGWFGRKRKSLLVIFSILFFVWGIIRISKGYSDFMRCNQAYIALHIFTLGFLYRKYENKIKMNAILAVICLAILVLLVHLDVHIEMARNVYTNYALFVVGEMAGIYLVVYISKWICRHIEKCASFFELIGKHSLTIMVQHVVCFKLVSLIAILYKGDDLSKLAMFPVYTEDVVWVLMYLLVGVLLPLIIGIIFEKIKKILQNVRLRMVA